MLSLCIKNIKLTLIWLTLFTLAEQTFAQVSYGAAANYGLRKIVTTYTSNAIQVRRACDNATANIGFTSCGDLDTTTLKNFVFSGNPLSAITPAAEGAYSLRKLRCAYTGSAINVRRSCDNATLDIGFNSNGDLDTVALKTFVMASNPISALSYVADAVYSLRKMRCAYVGNAIQVRRSSDNNTSNIGFTAIGDLDTATLKAFVGAGNGFITIWYDQSGNNYNLTQGTNGFQPRIVSAGVVDRPNGATSKPSIYFDGTDDYMTNSGYNRYLNSQTPTWNAVIFPKATINAYAPIVSWRSAGSVCSQLEIAGSNNWNNCWWSNNVNWTTTNGQTRTYDAYQIITHYIQATASQLYYNGTLSYNNTGQSNSPAVNTVLHTGTPLNVGVDNCCAGRFIKGYLNEIVLGSTNMSNTDRLYLEWSQAQYYGVSGPTLSSTLPTGVPSAFVATWYDQSGNNRHATQATAGLQPRIINAGLIEKNASNRPTIFFNGTYLKNAFFLTTQPVSTSCVWRARGLASPGGELFGWGNNSAGGRRYGAWFDRSSATQGRYGVENLGAGTVGSSLLNTNTWYISSQILPGTSLQALTQWINGTSQAMTNIGSPAAMNITAGEFAIGTIPTANVQGHNGDIQELVYFSSALSATDRQYIEYGQSVYYGISGPTVPSTLPVAPPSAYVSVWYDQSGNGINLSQTGAITRQPQIVNAGNIIRLNGASTWPTIQGTNALQTNLTATFSTAYTGNVLTVNSILRSDINSTGNLRVVSVGNTALTSADWNNTNNFNINQRNNNDFRFERNSNVNPSTTFVVGSPMILTGRFSGLVRQLFNNGTGSGIFAESSNFNFNSLRLLQSINPAFEATEALTGKMSEFSLYFSSLSTTRRALIESNQSAYYNITPLVNIKYTPPVANTYNRFVVGIGRESATDSVCETRQSAGMGFTCSTNAAAYLKDNTDFLTAGINCPITSSTSVANISAPIQLRWQNDWYVDKIDFSANGGTVAIYFDFSDYNIGASPGAASNYSLLNRPNTASNFTVVPSAVANVSGDRVYFTIDAANIVDNSYFTIGSTNPPASPLPIELLSFSGTCNENVSTLKWLTATETNNDYFTIERSLDGINYELIGVLDGAGNSLQTLNYSFLDTKPVEGTSYYRLKQTDFNGDFKYSKIITVNCTNKQLEVSIYPNPTSDELKIELAGNKETVNFEIINSIGVVVYKGSLNEKTSIQTSSFNSGIYIIRFMNGFYSEFQKVLKH